MSDGPLKTLKDIDGKVTLEVDFSPYTGEMDAQVPNAVDRNKLRKEAIRWAKLYARNDIGGLAGSWIMMFFNLTVEDLK